MRKQTIMSLERKMKPPREPGPLYFRSPPGQGRYRAMMDPEQTFTLAELRRKHEDLHPVALGMPSPFSIFSLEEIGAFVHSIGIHLQWPKDGADPEFLRAGRDVNPKARH